MSELKPGAIEHVDSVGKVSQLAGVNVLLMGPTGTGKTASIATLAMADPNLHVFCLFMESGLESLIGRFTDPVPQGFGLKEIPSNVHWHVLKPPLDGFSLLQTNAQNFNQLAVDGLFKVVDVNKHKYLDFYKSMLGQMVNFVDQRTGQAFGAVDSWGPDKVFCIDGLTGMTDATVMTRVGGSAVKSLPDYQIVQDQISKHIRYLTDGCKCHFVLLGHIEREVDQVQGGVKIMASTFGSKLAPRLPPMFSDVILTKRVGTTWTWSTSDSQTDLKTRNLQVADALPQDFKFILDKWKSRGGVICEKVKQ